jgi:hypothetical protein
MIRIAYILLIFIFTFISLSAQEEFSDEPAQVKVIIRLKNGDILSGRIIDYIEDDNGSGIRFKTQIGTTVIYSKEILEMKEYYDNYRHKHRVFLMPTAEPIGDDHFIGNYEIALFYAGFGISEYFSFTAGRSIIPGIPAEHQISLFNAKITLFTNKWDNAPGGMKVAIGTNTTFINHNNRIDNYYAVTTLHFDRSRLTGTIFTKNGPRDFYELKFLNNLYDLTYENGAFGVGLGLDTKLSNRHDIRFIGEIWNNNINQPTDSGVLLGVRHGNTEFSSDFGIAFFTQPFLIPFVSFTWTPFK